jgi:glycerol-3-phosphate dehydrogenase
MKVYDQLAGRLGLAPSRMLDRDETIARIPNVESEGLVGGVVYHDGQFDDARLAVALARTAVNHGAAVLNHCPVVGLLHERGGVIGVRARDAISGTELEIRARAVVNATGVFVDSIRRLDDPSARGLVAVSQGIHLVLPKRFLPGDAAIMVPKTSDGRVLFAVPWHDRVVVGTTDTPLDSIAEEPRALEEERAFVMEHARKYLAEDPVDTDVLSIFAGLRPLVKAGGNGTDTAALSRDHTIVVSESGLITITGGKWTTYRKMAEDVVDHAETVAGLDEKRCRTEELTIHGFTRDPIAEPNLRIYGTDADGIRSLATARPELAGSLHPKLPYTLAEIVWATRHEMACTLEDVLARRTRALLLDARASIEAAPCAAALMAAELGHDEAWQKAEVENYRRLARGYVYTDTASSG